MFLAKLSKPYCSLKLPGFDPHCQEGTLNQDNSTLLITDREFNNGKSEGHKETENAKERGKERGRERGSLGEGERKSKRLRNKENEE